MAAHQHTPPPDASSPSDSNIRKRVCKACDRCRLKKSKCDGASPCSRCKADNAICVFGERKKTHDKVYPKGYVEMLEQQQAQLVFGLQELYRRAQEGERWPGAPLKESSSGHPLTHDILERLGALRQDGHTNENFEEDLGALQQRLLANGAGFMQRHDSSDDSSESEHHSPTFPTKPANFPDTFAFNQYPPTPPNASPFPPSQQMPTTTGAPQLDSQLMSQGQAYCPPPAMQPDMNQVFLQRQSTWSQGSNGVDAMDFMLDDFDGYQSMPRYMRQVPLTGMNQCLPATEWNDEDAFKTFLNPNTLMQN